MELAMKTKPFCYLKRIMREVRRQEETGEVVVPDSYPDISGILCAGADVVIRGKDCRSGGVTISGGIKGTILYQPEGESLPRCLELYLPFSIKVACAELTERSQIVTAVYVRSAEGKMVNSRKALLRVELSCILLALEPWEDTIYTIQERPDTLQTKEGQYSLKLPLETSEKSFVLGDTLNLPTRCVQLYQFSCQVEVGESRILGNKGVFKGNLLCKALFLDENQRLMVHRQLFPFSQYCEFSQDFDEDTLDLYPCITGYDLELDGQEPAAQIPVTVHMLMQCVVSGKRTLNLLEDAYVTQGQWKPVWNHYELESELDRRQLPQTLCQTMEGTVTDVVDWTTYTDIPDIQSQGEETVVSVKTRVHILGYDQQGHLETMDGILEGSQGFAMEEHCVGLCDNVVSGPLSLLPTPNGLEARQEVTMDAQCIGLQRFTGLQGASVDETDPSVRRPSVVLRRISQDGTLWDIAKQSQARANSIRDANCLDTDQVHRGDILLIPMG